jgi:predicted RNA methylase
MRALQGRHEIRISGQEFADLAERFEAADLDVGTGDGRFVLARAAQHPERLLVGLDPVAGAMSDAANRVTRPRTRQDNVLFVVASVEQMPAELTGVFDRVFVLLPWGSLMRGLILADPEVLGPLASVGQPGAEYTFTLNLRIFSDPVPIEVQDLPEVTVAYVHDHLTDLYREHGLEITSARLLDRVDLDALRTTWVRRLSHERPPPSIEITARRL